MKENNENTMTYEEAKIILKNSVGDEIDKARSKAEKLRAGLVIAVSLTIGAVGLMLGTDDPMSVMLPAAMVSEIPLLMETITRVRTNKKILDDSFFEKRTPDEVIKCATEYKENYESYIKNQGGKSL